MEDPIALPDLNAIETWLGEQCYLERARLRNELAFIHGDSARGGPPRDDLALALKSRLAAIAKRLEVIDPAITGSDCMGRKRINVDVSQTAEAVDFREPSISKRQRLLV